MEKNLHQTISSEEWWDHLITPCYAIACMQVKCAQLSRNNIVNIVAQFVCNSSMPVILRGQVNRSLNTRFRYCFGLVKRIEQLGLSGRNIQGEPKLTSD